MDVPGKKEGNAPSSIENGEKIEVNNNRVYFSTIDLMYIAILGLMGGFLSSYSPFEGIIKGLVPPGFPLPQIVSGHHVLWMVLAYGLTLKHGSPLMTALVKGILEFLLGDFLGVVIIFLNLFEGASIEFFLAIFRRWKHADNKWTLLSWCVAAGFGNSTQPPVFSFVKGFLFINPPWITLLAMAFAFISGALIAGYLGFYLVRLLRAAGVVRKPVYPMVGHALERSDN